ncbi:hypothetical protein [Neobacillus mesonae]|uniref:hypothetical protein n=1 Tax=Neobacillus mesonae TaxID=1193713 RepID=UPI0025734046|nr:hypothetical protein [Neobacillus mesonae]
MKDTKKITFNGEKFEIKKVPIRRFGQLALTIENLPDLIKDLAGNTDGSLVFNPQEILAKVPQMLFELGETLPRFLSVASDIDIEKVLEGGIDDITELLQAVLEINNIEVIIKNLKNLRMVLPK